MRSRTDYTLTITLSLINLGKQSQTPEPLQTAGRNHCQGHQSLPKEMEETWSKVRGKTFSPVGCTA